MRRLIGGLLIAGLVLPALAGETIVGQAHVIDGDTLAIGAVRIRLHGIDAPEGGQLCQTESGGNWDCGRAATRELEHAIGRREVHCEERDIDRYGRTVAVCRAGEEDTGAALVRAGLALAFVRYSRDYVADQAAAEAAKRGMWQGQFEPPWEWRKKSRSRGHPPDVGSRRR